MNKKMIRVDIDKKGSATLNFDGFQGDMCLKKAQEIYDLLNRFGVNVDSIETKDPPVTGSIIKESEGMNLQKPNVQTNQKNKKITNIS